MQWWNNLLSNWAPWVALVGGAFGILGWAIGLQSVLRIVASVVESLSPILKAVSVAAVGILGWIWFTLVWPPDPKQISIRRGVTDIADDWVTLGCVALLAWGIWAWGDRKVNQLTDNLSACQSEVVKLKKSQERKSGAKTGNEWLWLFPW